jgi:sulfur relay (sulfurtransferase) complex TusBCD TusD component (DsrE family)
MTVSTFADFSPAMRSASIHYLAKHQDSARNLASSALKHNDVHVRRDALVLAASAIRRAKSTVGWDGMLAAAVENVKSPAIQEQRAAIVCLAAANHRGQFDDVLFEVASARNEVRALRIDAMLAFSSADKSKRMLLRLLDDTDMVVTSIGLLRRYEPDAEVALAFLRQAKEGGELPRAAATEALRAFFRVAPDVVKHQLRAMAVKENLKGMYLYMERLE